MMYWFCKFLAKFLLKCFFGFKQTGLENIPKKGGFILASNHVSHMDPIVLSAACPRMINFMAKKELFTGFLFSRWLFSLRAFPVNRNAADIGAIREAFRRVKAGQGLLLFPEGRRNEGDSIGKPEEGVGFLAAKLKVPVVPAYVQGTKDALPKGSTALKFSKVSVRFGKQIIIEGDMPYQEIAGMIMVNIKNISC
ncbi:MAG: lysophospholipid acyltransferase family protein [Candidatus Omnitrophica bacterium]|nr:lysophospholipid acyltransferase family protein [Candidatus Omnitrophota bacterium]